MLQQSLFGPFIYLSTYFGDFFLLLDSCAISSRRETFEFNAETASAAAARCQWLLLQKRLVLVLLLLLLLLLCDKPFTLCV